MLIFYIFGFRKDIQLIEYTKDQWVDQQHQDVFQWARNTQNIIRYDNELKLIMSFNNDIFININFLLQCFPS